jgi:hypothetical protein
VDLRALVVAFALIAMRVPEVRYLNAAVAVWLLLSVWILPTFRIGTIWNNALVAIAIFIVSMVRGVAGPAIPPRGTVPPP